MSDTIVGTDEWGQAWDYAGRRLYQEVPLLVRAGGGTIRSEWADGRASWPASPAPVALEAPHRPGLGGLWMPLNRFVCVPVVAEAEHHVDVGGRRVLMRLGVVDYADPAVLAALQRVADWWATSAHQCRGAGALRVALWMATVSLSVPRADAPLARAVTWSTLTPEQQRLWVQASLPERRPVLAQAAAEAQRLYGAS